MEIARRDVRLALRRAGDTVAVVTFFVIAIVLFPLGVGPELSVLARIASGTIWVAALLAAMLSLDRLFLADHDDGSLDLLLVAPVPLEVAVLAKCAAHWLTTGVPLIVTAPLLAVLMNLSFEGLGALVLAMALGTPTLSLVGRRRRRPDRRRATRWRTCAAPGLALGHPSADIRGWPRSMPRSSAQTQARL